MPKKTKAPDIIRDNEELAAVVAKLHSSNTASSADKRNNLYQTNLQAISASTESKVTNNDNITQLFPDIELATQILVSSILSPNDMTTTALSYRHADIALPSEVKAMLSNAIKYRIDKLYDLESKLPTIVREALVTKGAYAEVIIPEAALDEVINSDIYKNMSLEEYGNNGAKKKKEYLSLEDSAVTYNALVGASNKFNVGNTTLANSLVKDNDLLISITEDISILAAPTILSKKLSKNMISSVRKLTNFGNEAFTMDMDKLFRKPQYDSSSYLINISGYDETKRKSIGIPLVYKVPTESVVPIHVVNDPSIHLGYFITLDEKGKPISGSEDNKYDYDDQNQINANDNKLNIINNAKKALYGITKKEPTLTDLDELYGTMVESKLKRRLSDGILKDYGVIEDAKHVYRAMFERALKGQTTRILFVPSDQLAYYAFDYRSNGTGKSIIEKSALLFSLRAITLFTRLMASIKNSTTTTKITASIDEDDMNPERTAELIVSEALKTRQTSLPIGVTRIDDMVDWTHKYGIVFDIKHPDLPDLNIESSEINTNKVIPDDTLENNIKDQIIRSFGLTSEMVDNTSGPEFATSLISNNILFNRRIITYQDILNPHITAHIKKLILNDAGIRDELTELILSNMASIKKYITKNSDDQILEKILKDDEAVAEYLVYTYINEMYVELARPESSSRIENISKSFEDYEKFVDTFLNSVIGGEAGNDSSIDSSIVGEEVSNSIPILKKAIKTILLKNWAYNNGQLTELSEFLSIDDEGNYNYDILTEYISHAGVLSKAVKDMLNATVKLQKANKKAMDKITDKLNDERDDYANDDNDMSADETPSEDSLDIDTDTAADDTDMDNAEPTDIDTDTENVDDTGIDELEDEFKI